MKALVSFVVALFAVTAVGGEEKQPLDPAKLVGDWVFVSLEYAGEKVPNIERKGKVTVTKDTALVPDVAPDVKYLMAYKIDAKASPALIDMEIKDGPQKGGKAEGIIAMQGDELRLCLVLQLGDDKPKRPTKFESTKENKALYYVLKRAK
jgi:uncharacterized protein (TIGR03067 family)